MMTRIKSHKLLIFELSYSERHRKSLKFYYKLSDEDNKIISRATQAVTIAVRGTSLAIVNSDSRGLA